MGSHPGSVARYRTNTGWLLEKHPVATDSIFGDPLKESVTDSSVDGVLTTGSLSFHRSRSSSCRYGRSVGQGAREWDKRPAPPERRDRVLFRTDS